jgi:hypothetical protein
VCDECSAAFRSVDELARHKKSHEVDGKENELSGTDNPQEKESGTDYENGVMDAPGPAPVASGDRADAKRDVNLDRESESVEAAQSRDVQ